MSEALTLPRFFRQEIHQILRPVALLVFPVVLSEVQFGCPQDIPNEPLRFVRNEGAMQGDGARAPEACQAHVELELTLLPFGFHFRVPPNFASPFTSLKYSASPVSSAYSALTRRGAGVISFTMLPAEVWMTRFAPTSFASNA